MPRTMWQALAGYLGSNTTASPGEEGKTIFIAETNDWGLLKEAFARVVPLGRFGDADEIAKAVAFLASDEASYASRIELFVDGDVAQV